MVPSIGAQLWVRSWMNLNLMSYLGTWHAAGSIWWTLCRSTENFDIRILGGSWTMARSGRSHDAYRGIVLRQGGEAALFAKGYGFSLGARYNIELYGDEGAMEMAKTWFLSRSSFSTFGEFRRLRIMCSQTLTFDLGSRA